MSRTSRFVLAMTFPVLSLIGASVAAQIPSSSSNLKGREKSEAEGYAIVRKVAGCTISDSRSRPIALLASAPGSRAEQGITVAGMSRYERCIPAESGVTFSISIWRGAVAETLYAADFPAGVISRADLDMTPWVLEPLSTIAVAQLGVIHNFARCIVVAAPGAVRDMMGTEPFSNREMKVIGTMNAAMSGCLGANQKFTTNRTMLRSLLAEALYKYSIAQRDGQVAGYSATSKKN